MTEKVSVEGIEGSAAAFHVVRNLQKTLYHCLCDLKDTGICEYTVTAVALVQMLEDHIMDGHERDILPHNYTKRVVECLCDGLDDRIAAKLGGPPKLALVDNEKKDD